jgi:hypothetical protein
VDPVTCGGKGQRTGWAGDESVGRVMLWKIAWSGMHLFDLLNFFTLSKVRLLEGWQIGWNGSVMGRYA